LREHSKKYKSFEEYLIDLLKKLDKNGNGTVEYEELVSGLKDLGFNLTY